MILHRALIKDISSPIHATPSRRPPPGVGDSAQGQGDSWFTASVYWMFYLAIVGEVLSAAGGGGLEDFFMHWVVMKVMKDEWFSGRVQVLEG